MSDSGAQPGAEPIPAKRAGAERDAGGQPGGGQPEGELSYEAASARVEEIIRRLDSGQASLDETLALLGEGKRLIELCARELSAVGDALEELRLDELVSRLEGAAGA